MPIGAFSPLRSGASHAAIAPYGPFRCAAGEQAFLGIQNEREWAAFCATVLEQPELATEDRFRNNTLRVANRGGLTGYIEAVFANLSADEVIDRLERAGIANARLRDMAGLAAHPQLAARERWREVDSPVGSLRALVPPGMLDGEEPAMGPIPEAGEHTSSILAELGLHPAVVAEPEASRHDPELLP